MTKSQFSAIYMQYYFVFNAVVTVHFLLLNEILNFPKDFIFFRIKVIK